MKLASELSVDMRADQGVKRICELLVLALAAHGTVLRQKPFFDHIAEQLRIEPVGDAEQIEEALRRCAVLVGERW